MTNHIDDDLTSWIGRTRVVEDEVSRGMVRRIAGMLDLDPRRFDHGDALPPHWFTLFCPETPRTMDLAPDGLLRPGEVVPDIALPRRMGAGRRATVHACLRVGDVVEKTSMVSAIEPKSGRTGPMVLLTVRHTLRVAGETIAVEEFDTLYRGAAPSGGSKPVSVPTPAPAIAAWHVDQLLSPQLNFRYSAVVWNTHRIHYDADFARDVEGYPAAIQNGNLTAQLLLDAAVAHTPGRLRGFSVRYVRALYVGDTVTLAGQALQDGRAIVWAQDAEGRLCAQVDCVFSPD